MNAVVKERATNHMDPDTRLVHARLEAWAKECADRWNPWPRKTLLGRLCDQENVVGLSQGGRPPTIIPEHVAAVDAAVSRLGEIDRKVIRAYYFREEPVEAVARRVHMRVRMFQSVLRRARWRIGGYLAALE